MLMGHDHWEIPQSIPQVMQEMLKILLKHSKPPKLILPDELLLAQQSWWSHIKEMGLSEI